jgi:hypothetical protein
MIRKIIFSFLSIIFILIGCDGGIEPQAGGAGFGGRITFIGQWPDSVTRTHIVVFKDSLLSPGNFSLQNIRFVSNEIPFGVSSFQYSSRDSSVLPGNGSFQPGEYNYVAVAQSSIEDVSLNREDWFVVGLYFTGGDTLNPGTLVIPENTYINNINMICDFNNPPPQPPGGN